MLFAIIANLLSLTVFSIFPSVGLKTIDVSGLDQDQPVLLVSSAYKLNQPYRKTGNSLGIKVSAASAMVVDQNSNAVLWQKNPNQPRSLASISKLMTALVFLDHNPGWDAEVIIQPSDHRSGGRTYIFSGQKITVRDLFNASLVASSNDATVALARSTGLSTQDFVAAMNQKAKDLGMGQSVFYEPTGLNPQNISSAYDIIKLAKAAFARAEIRSATIQSEYNLRVINTGQVYNLKSTDKLLGSYLQINAGKTGFLDEAGYCLTSEVVGPAGQNILVVVMGSDGEFSRFQDLKSLAQWAFDNYAW